MKFTRTHLPIMLLAMAFMMSFILVVNFQWLHMGYEGLLYNSFQKLLEKDFLKIQGGLKIGALDGPEEDDLLTLELTLEGIYHISKKKGHLSMVMEQGNGLAPIPMGMITIAEETLMLEDIWGSGESLDLTSYMEGVENEKNNDLWHRIYPFLSTTEVLRQDMRQGKSHLPRELIRYSLDPTLLLADEEKTWLLTQDHVFDDVSNMNINVYVTKGGELSLVEGAGSFGSLDVSGWLTVH